MLPDIANSAPVHRLRVLVLGLQVEQLLGVPKFVNDTGEAISNAIVTIV